MQNKHRKKNLSSLSNKNNISLLWGKKGVTSQVWMIFLSKEEHISFQNSTVWGAALLWDVPGHERDALVLLSSWLPQGRLSPKVSFLFPRVGFYSCWTVDEIKLFFLSFPRQYPKRISESKSSLHYILFFARQSGHNSALDFTSGNEITLNRNGFNGGWNSNCRVFLLLEKRQVSSPPKFPLNRSAAAAECQLGIELPRENTWNTNTLSAVLRGMFSFRKIKPRSAEIHKMTNSKNFKTVVHTCIFKSCATGSSGYRTNPNLCFVYRKSHLEHTILSVSRHGNDWP